MEYPESYIFLSLSSHCPLIKLVYLVGFVIAGVVAVTVYGVADVSGTMIVVSAVDTLVAVVVASA